MFICGFGGVYVIKFAGHVILQIKYRFNGCKKDDIVECD